MNVERISIQANNSALMAIDQTPAHPMRIWQDEVVIVGEPGCFGGTQLGATTSGLLGGTNLRLLVVLAPTQSGIAPVAGKRTAESFVHEARRLSGLTWSQLAQIFGVSRRSVHLWASGKPLTVEHEIRLNRVLAFIHKIDRGEARSNRALMMAVRSDGKSVIQLLQERRFQDAENLAGRLAIRRSRPTTGVLSPEARDARRPPRPAELVGALQDSVNKDEGRLKRELSRPLKRLK